MHYKYICSSRGQKSRCISQEDFPNTIVMKVKQEIYLYSVSSTLYAIIPYLGIFSHTLLMNPRVMHATTIITSSNTIITIHYANNYSG